MATMSQEYLPNGAEPVWRAPDAHSHLSPGEIAVGVVIGRTSEYFDFFVYGLASVLIFPTVFFPHMATLDGMLWSFAIFALAFVVRPLGTIGFMKVQERWGRGAKLTGALVLLGTATCGIAFLPGFATIGGDAIALLVVFRILQGVAVGGSWDGLPSLLSINAPPSRRGWYAMLGQLGAPFGFMLAGGLFYYLHANLSTYDFMVWGWRYVFYVAFAINVVALFARLRLVVTEEYTSALEKHELEPVSVTELLRTQGSNIAIGAFASLATYALFHLVTIFPLSWFTLGVSQSEESVLGVQIVGAGLAVISVVASGLIADRIGRRNTLGLVAALIGVFSVCVPWLLQGGPAAQNAFILVGFILLGFAYGQASGIVSSNFAPHYRYTGAALTADFAWLIGAAFAPLVALGLSAKFGPVAVGVYMLSGVLCTLLALMVNRKLATRDD
jgi:MFS family permease